MFPSQVLTDGAITLRPLRGSDASHIAVAGNDSEIQKWLPLPRPYTLDDANHFIDEISVEALAVGSGIVFAIDLIVYSKLCEDK